MKCMAMEEMPVCQYCGRTFWGPPRPSPICVPCMDDADRMQASEEVEGLSDYLEDGMSTPLTYLVRNNNPA